MIPIIRYPGKDRAVVTVQGVLRPGEKKRSADRAQRVCSAVKLFYLPVPW